MLNRSKDIINYLLGFSLCVLTSIMFLQVLLRYIFNYSLTWSEEFPRIILIWIVFFGLVTIDFEEHLYVDLIKNNKFTEIFRMVVTIFVLSVFIYWGFVLCYKIRFQIFPVTQISRSFQYAAAPVAYFITLFIYIYKFIQLIKWKY